jgi:hypothetical protein
MPYEVRKVEDGCEVINSETKEVKAHHTDCEDAHRQVRLLEAIEHDENFKPRED